MCICIFMCIYLYLHIYIYIHISTRSYKSYRLLCTGVHAVGAALQVLLLCLAIRRTERPGPAVGGRRIVKSE